VHTFHFGNYPIPRRQLWIELIFARLAHRIVAVGEVQRQQLQSRYWLSDRVVRVIRNGVAPAPSMDGAAFRAQVGAGDRMLVGTIARLTDQKGLHDLLTVASHFRPAKDRVLFVVVGEGSLRRELEERRRTLGLDDMVVFTGWVPDAARVALPEFEVFLQPSHWEAMSISILEAMAAGKPVVATRVGETPKMIEDGVDGLLVDVRDTQAMAYAVGRLVEDRSLSTTIGAAAARKVAQSFNLERMTRAYEDLYVEVAGTRGRGPAVRTWVHFDGGLL
jgi:glycosyltransferase involved in cell wall biosynthesis